MRKFLFTFAGVFVGVLADLLIHYIAAATLNLPFIEQLFSPLGIAILVILVLLCLAIGVTIEKFSKPTPSLSQAPLNSIGGSVTQTMIARKGSKISKSPQRVKGHVVDGKIIQNISLTNNSELTESEQNTDIT